MSKQKIREREAASTIDKYSAVVVFPQTTEKCQSRCRFSTQDMILVRSGDHSDQRLAIALLEQNACQTVSHETPETQ
jgi:hypothetical protein